MVFKHRRVWYGLSIGTFLTGLANLALYLFNHELQTAVVGAICIVFGIGYLMMLATHPRPK